MSEWYYAHGGEQKGPVPVSQLKRRADNGEFDPHGDLVWREGMTDWTPAASAPGLESLFPPPPAPGDVPPPAPGGSVNPYAAPSTVDPYAIDDTVGDLPEIEPGSEPLGIGECLSHAFQLTKTHFGMILAAGILMLAISIGVGMVTDVIDQMMGHTPPQIDYGTGNVELDEALNEIADQGSILSRIINGVVEVFLGLGITRIGLNIIDGKPFTIGTLFSQGSKLIRAYFAQLLFGIMVGLGLLLLIVPGVYLALRFGQYQHAIVDKNLGIFDAFSYSARITQGQKWTLLGFFLLLVLIIIAGALALLVGLIFAIPLTTIAWLVAYRWMQHGSAICQPRVS